MIETGLACNILFNREAHHKTRHTRPGDKARHIKSKVPGNQADQDHPQEPLNAPLVKNLQGAVIAHRGEELSQMVIHNADKIRPNHKASGRGTPASASDAVSTITGTTPQESISPIPRIYPSFGV